MSGIPGVLHILEQKDHGSTPVATEYSLLSLFAQNEGKVLTQQYILKQIWGTAFIQQSQYLRVYVAQLAVSLIDSPFFFTVLDGKSISRSLK